MKIPIKILKGKEAKEWKRNHRNIENTNFPNGGYFKQEEVEPGITIMEMDSKGFMEKFGKDMFK